jgi:hypothetical protein
MFPPPLPEFVCCVLLLAFGGILRRFGGRFGGGCSLGGGGLS